MSFSGPATDAFLTRSAAESNEIANMIDKLNATDIQDSTAISKPAIVETATQRALGISEILKEILMYLSTGDILCNAHRVSTFWRDCIQDWQSLRQKCFLAKEEVNETQDPLFLQLHTPRRAKEIYYFSQPLIDFCATSPEEPLTLTRARKALMAGHLAIYDYAFLITKLKPVPVSEQEVERPHDEYPAIRVLRHANPWADGHYQLDPKCLNPFVASLLSSVSHCFTGQEAHVVLVIGTRSDCIRELTSTVQAIVSHVQKDPSGATWKQSFVTRPTATEFTVCGMIQRLSIEERSLSTFLENTNGVTVEDFFLLVVKLCETAIVTMREGDYPSTYIGAREDMIETMQVGLKALDEYEDYLGHSW